MEEGKTIPQDRAELLSENSFLPGKPAGSEYGYLDGDKPVDCSREELIVRCRERNWNGKEITLAWTPEVDYILPVERIPLLFEALRGRRRKAAQSELLMSCGWAAMLLSEYLRSSEMNLRHLFVLLGFAAVLPAVYAIRSWRLCNALTPEALARESTGYQVRFWLSRQKTPGTIRLVLLCSAVTLSELFTPLTNGSAEAAALVHDAVMRGEIWRALTCGFVHANLLHLLCNATGLAVFGSLIEATIGRGYVPLVFLVTALSGSVFSLFLNTNSSVGASGGILGLAGFAFVNAGRFPILNSLGVQKLCATVLTITALGGIVAYDLFDSAAHLGGLLAGLGLGWAIRRPSELVRRGTFRLASAAAWVLLGSGALAAIGLTLRPSPINRAQPTSTKLSAPADAKTLNPLLSLALEPVSSREMPLVAQSLAEQDSAVGYVAAYRLSRLGQTAVPELTRCLSNAAPQARIWAACSLGMIGSEAVDSAPALAVLLEDTDPHARMAAGYALRRMNANPPGAAQALVRGLALGAIPIWRFWLSTEHEEELGARLCILRGEDRWMPIASAGGSGGVEGIATDPANRPFWSGFFVDVRLAAERYAWEILAQATDLEFAIWKGASVLSAFAYEASSHRRVCRPPRVYVRLPREPRLVSPARG